MFDKEFHIVCEFPLNQFQIDLRLNELSHDREYQNPKLIDIFYEKMKPSLNCIIIQQNKRLDYELI